MPWLSSPQRIPTPGCWSRRQSRKSRIHRKAGIRIRRVSNFENFPDRFEAAYRLELEAFFRALQEGLKPAPGPEDALETLRLALAVTKSWREGRPVKIREIQREARANVLAGGPF